MPNIAKFRNILILSALILTGLLLAGAVGLAADPPADRALTLRSVQITGNEIVSTKQILKEFTLILPSRWPWKKLPAFHEEELERTIRRIQALYRKQGFFHATITPKVHIDEKDRVEVELIITEGPWVEITEIKPEVAETERPLPLEKLAEQWPLKPGDRFVESSYEELKRLYLNYLLDHGFPRAKVEGKVCMDEKRNSAEIFLKITPGLFSYFGEVRIEGRPTTPDYLILRKLTFKKGDMFAFDQIYQSQRNLYDLDLFSSVAVTPAEVPETERHIPIIIKVEEKKKVSVKVGLGYGSEELVRARLGLRTRNVGGGGRILDFEGKYSRIDSKFTSTFKNPYIGATYFDLVSQGGYVRRDLPSYSDNALFVQTRLERDLPWNFRVYFGHSLEIDRPFDIPGQTLRLFKENQERQWRSSAAILGLRRDTTDDQSYPSRGGIFLASGEAAPDFFGSNWQFLRTVVGIRHYLNLWEKKFILAGRIKLGLIGPVQDTEEIPIFRRFFCGGYTSVRGYRLDYLGPRDSAGNPIGGNALLEGSVELRFPIYKDFRGVAFLDAGNVYPVIGDLDVGQLKYAAGVGVRYLTPIGPVGVDVGFPLNPIDPKQDHFRVNFSIGQAF